VLRFFLIIGLIVLVTTILTRGLRGKKTSSPPKTEKPKLIRDARADAAAMERAHDIVRALAGDDPLPHADIDLAARDLSAFSDRSRERGSIEFVEPPTAGEAACAVLQWHGYISDIDHRSDTDELKEALDPLLERRGIPDFDWSFIDDLEAAENWEALKNDNLLPIVAKHVARRGAVMIFVNPGTGDNYDFAVGSRAQYEQLRALKCEGFDVSDEHSPW